MLSIRGILFVWSESSKKYQLVKQNEEGKTLFVIAFFDRHKEGYDMRTVGSRFFDAGLDAWRVGMLATHFLNKAFLESRQEEDLDDGLLDNPSRL